METQNTFEQCISKMNKITAFSFLTTRCFVVLINNIAAEQKKNHRKHEIRCLSAAQGIK